MVPAPQGSIILDLDIAGFEGTGDTKAVKNGWADGDKLNLWFDDWNYTAQANNPTPDLVITYDGSQSKWIADKLAAGRSLKSSGKFSVLYEGFNKLSEYTPSFSSSSNSQWFRPHRKWYDGGEVYFKPLVYGCDGIDYTYAGNKLTATISDWRTPTALKVLVKGLSSADAESYILQTANVTTPGTEEYASCVGPIVVNISSVCPTFGHGSANYKGYVGGVPDTDGVAFYYNGCNFTTADIEFRLFKKNASGAFEKTANAKFTGKTLVVVDDKKTIGVAIDISKFK